MGETGQAAGESTKIQLKIIQQSLDHASKEYNPSNPQQIVPSLIEAKKAVTNLTLNPLFSSGNGERRKMSVGEADVSFIAWEKLSQLTKAIKLAAGIQIETLVNQETVTPGETFLAAIKVFFSTNPNIKIKEIRLSSS